MSPKKEVLELFKDYEWHCCSCAKVSTSQIAAHVRNLIKEGCEFEQPSPNRFCKYAYCENCKRATIHRRLVKINTM